MTSDLPSRVPEEWRRKILCTSCGRPTERFRTEKLRRVFVVCPICDLVRGNVATVEYM